MAGRGRGKHIGRTAKFARYKAEGRLEKNHLKKLKKVAKNQPNNLQVQNRIRQLEK